MKNNYFKPTAKRWKNIQLSLKAMFATLGGSAIAAENPYLGFAILLAGGIIDTIIEFLAPEDTQQ